MASKPQITRRNFVQRAGLLVSALGLSSTVQTGMMEKILKKAHRKWGREALAQQTSSPVKFLVEINYRAGAQINSLFPSAGHMTPVAQQSPRLNIYSSPANIIPMNRDGRDVYFARFTAGQGGDRLKTLLETNPALSTVGIAQSEAINLQTGQHTGNFSSRAPTGAAPCPAILHASMVAASRPVQGIEWTNGGGVTNQTAGLAALSRVNSRAQFTSLFRDVPMYFTRDELKLIVGAFNDDGTPMPGQEGAVAKLDAIWRAQQDPRSGVFDDNDAVVVNSKGGRNQSTLSLIATIQANYDAQAPKFGGTIANPDGGTPLGEALNSAAAAFSAGATSTFTVALDKNDWHTDIQAFDTVGSKQGQMNIVHGNALAGLWDAAASLPDPDEPGKTVADSLLVMISSEFTRTPLRNGGGVGSDNGDGGTQMLLLMGKMVRNGSYGNIRGTDGAVVGFDRTTGALGGTAPSEMQVYRTSLKLLGLDNMAGTYGVGAAMPLDCVIRST